VFAENTFNLQQVSDSVHGCSKLGLIDLICVDGGVKINGTYYNDLLLTQKLLPVVNGICAIFFKCS